MKIVVAMDSFKGSLPAVRACAIAAEALRAELADADVEVKPMADGGEGTAAALMAATGGQWVTRTAMGPLPKMRVEAGFVWLAESQAAAVEMAAASGLQLLPRQRQNPMNTTTYGTGELIAAAAEHGAQRILLAVGGSATVDGGVGAAMALGWQFLDRDGRQTTLGGKGLAEIRQIVPAAPLAAEVDVLCDVDNPLCGANGAARVYGPQKGADPPMVEALDTALSRLADLVAQQLGCRIKDLPGAGAAGGLAAGAVAFMDAHLVSGIDAVMSQSRLSQALADAEWAITGEGCFDEQSLRGKVVSGVTRLARAAGARVAVLAGQVRLGPEDYRRAGIEAALPCMDTGMGLDAALARSEELLDRAARRLARDSLGV
jgi:glycerate kinase